MDFDKLSDPVSPQPAAPACSSTPSHDEATDSTDMNMAFPDLKLTEDEECPGTRLGNLHAAPVDELPQREGSPSSNEDMGDEKGERLANELRRKITLVKAELFECDNLVKYLEMKEKAIEQTYCQLREDIFAKDLELSNPVAMSADAQLMQQVMDLKNSSENLLTWVKGIRADAQSQKDKVAEAMRRNSPWRTHQGILLLDKVDEAAMQQFNEKRLKFAEEEEKARQEINYRSAGLDAKKQQLGELQAKLQVELKRKSSLLLNLELGTVKKSLIQKQNERMKEEHKRLREARRVLLEDWAAKKLDLEKKMAQKLEEQKRVEAENYKADVSRCTNDMAKMQDQIKDFNTKEQSLQDRIDLVIFLSNAIKESDSVDRLIQICKEGVQDCCEAADPDSDDQLHQQLQELKASLGSLLEDSAKMEKDLSGLRELIASLEAEKQQLEGQQSALADLEGQEEALTCALEQERIQRDDLEKKVHELESEMEKLGQDRIQLQELKLDLERQIGTALENKQQREKEEATKNLESLLERKEKLMAKLQEETLKKVSAERELEAEEKRYEAELGAVKQEREHRGVQIMQDIERLEQELKRLDERAAEARQQSFITETTSAMTQPGTADAAAESHQQEGQSTPRRVTFSPLVRVLEISAESPVLGRRYVRTYAKKNASVKRWRTTPE